jgi:monoamine oxidase
LDLWQLLASDFWYDDINKRSGPKLHFGEHYHQGATMLQPVGGMGRIGEAFARKLKRLISYGCEVSGIFKTSTGARVVWRQGKKGGVEYSTDAHYVICTIPLPVLSRISNNFSSDIQQAIRSVPYVPAGKIAFQAERRFWELDHHIYGGISWTTRDITQIWYPSAGIHNKKGILVGGYVWDDRTGLNFSKKTPTHRAKDAIADGEHLHPSYGDYLSRAISVAWSNIPFTGGGWADWKKDIRTTYYPILMKGDGAILFSGDHMSYLSGWQEGAVLSAHRTVCEIGTRVSARKV